MKMIAAERVTVFVGQPAMYAGTLCAAGSNHNDPADIACVATEAAKVTTLVKGLFKCGGKCENDYKDKKGNGGTTDAGNDGVGGIGADAPVPGPLTVAGDGGGVTPVAGTAPRP